MAFRVCLRYIHSLRRLDHVSHLETSVMGASLAYYTRIQLFLFCFVRSYEEFGSSGSSLSCAESVFCCTWVSEVKCAAPLT
jgi:hypothetical protein